MYQAGPLRNKAQNVPDGGGGAASEQQRLKFLTDLGVKVLLPEIYSALGYQFNPSCPVAQKHCDAVSVLSPTIRNMLLLVPVISQASAIEVGSAANHLSRRSGGDSITCIDTYPPKLAENLAQQDHWAIILGASLPGSTGLPHSQQGKMLAVEKLDWIDPGIACLASVLVALKSGNRQHLFANKLIRTADPNLIIESNSASLGVMVHRAIGPEISNVGLGAGAQITY